ncbi:MAG TPA: hypothetical protein VE868_02755 [Balneolaceae bacterium]|nr:hypothetical protein [Balneolaceae bacterium]
MYNKKTIILFIFLLSACLSSSIHAQSSVSIRQEGRNNSATIKQGRADQAVSSQKPSDCTKMHKHLNYILIQRKRDKIDTLVETAAKKKNTVPESLRRKGLLAAQYGDNNILDVILADSSKQQRLKSSQKGSGNRTSAKLYATQELIVSQNGSGNKIAINPCENGHRSPKSQNRIKIHQKGQGNTATVIHR